MSGETLPAVGSGPGRARQNQIYRAGVLGRRPAVPTDFAALERRARRASTARGWAYVAGGAGLGRTLRNNREATTGGPSGRGFRAWNDVTCRSTYRNATADRLFRRGLASSITEDSDLLIAGAAARPGVPYVFTNQGGSPMEATAGPWVKLRGGCSSTGAPTRHSSTA